MVCKLLFGIGLSNKKFLFQTIIDDVDHGGEDYIMWLYDMELKQRKSKEECIRDPILIDEHSFDAIKRSRNEIAIWTY